MVVLNPDILPQMRMTVDEYLDADLPEGFRYELVEGVVQVSPTPDFPHDTVLDYLNLHFTLYRAKRPDLIAHISQRAAVTLEIRHTAREPDFAVYAPAQIAQIGKVRKRAWKKLTPLLLVEVVSEGQEERDYEDKRKDYRDAEVPEYWIADQEQETLTVLIREVGNWREQVFRKGETYRPDAFPGLEIPIDELFS